jgi:hypothetical protein
VIEQPMQGRVEDRTVPVQPVPAGGAVVLPSPGTDSSARSGGRRSVAGALERLQPFLRNKKAVFGAVLLLGFASSPSSPRSSRRVIQRSLSVAATRRRRPSSGSAPPAPAKMFSPKRSGARGGR